MRNIRRKSRKRYSGEEKIRIVLEGLRGEETVAELRRLQAAGAGLFGLSSLLIGLAPSIELANAIRILAGLAAAMVAASGLALVHGIFKGKERALTFGLWGATASLGVAIGPVIGRMAVTYFSWRAAFFIVVPIFDLGLLKVHSFRGGMLAYFRGRSPSLPHSSPWPSVLTMS